MMRMRDRDKLMGAPRGSSATVGSRTRLSWVFILGAAAILLLIVGGAFVWGQKSAVTTSTTSVTSTPTAPPTKKTPPEDVSAREPVLEEPGARRSSPTVETQPHLTLGPTTPADYQNHLSGSGASCGCSFDVGATRSGTLLVVVDNLALYRPNGEVRICTLSESQQQQMLDSDVIINCGQGRVSIQEIDQVRAGSEGPNIAARMTVYEGNIEETFTGTWSCGC